VVAVRIVPVKIARARLGQPEVSAHRGRGDGRVVSAVCGLPPESVALFSIKEKEKPENAAGFGQHKNSRVLVFQVFVCVHLHSRRRSELA
jgi:hypothetical protein